MKPAAGSIRARLLWSLLALFAAVALAMAAVTYRNALAETEALFDYQLRQMALSLRDQGEIGAAQADSLADETLDFVVQIWSADGRQVYASRRHPALPARAVLGLATLRADGRAWRSYAVATRSRVIQVAQPVDIRESLAAEAAWRTVLPLLLLAPAAALGLAAIAAYGLRPLRRLAGELRQRDAGSLAPLAAGPLPDEIAPLAAALDALLGRLRAAQDAQRAFVADAAHELRSPLQALTLQLAGLRRAGGDAARAAAERDLAAGIERATRLVNQLLALARSDAGGDAAAAVRAPVDLAETVRAALADAAPLAGSRRVGLALDAKRPAVIEGDAFTLGLLVRNLVDNAVRHSPAGATVEVSLDRAGGGPDDAVVLTVDDAGPGIPEADRTRVFDRFVRRADAADAASGADGGAGSTGSGLGLAIVRNVADAHGATVTLATSPPGGLRAAVAFPAGAGVPA